MRRQNEKDDEKDEERKRGESVQGGWGGDVGGGVEHTGIGRGCRGPPQCSAVHEKTERRNKNTDKHANSQQRDDRAKAYTAWRRGSCGECSVLRWWGLGWGTGW